MPQGKWLLAAVLSASMIEVAKADLSDEDPAVLCSLLEPDGVVMTGYVPPGPDERPRCTIPDDQIRAEVMRVGYILTYSVSPHHSMPSPATVALQFRGPTSQVLNASAQERWRQMVNRIAAHVFTHDGQRAINEIAGKLETSRIFSFLLEGMNVQLVQLEQPALPGHLELRFTIANACPPAEESPDYRSVCLRERAALEWLSRPDGQPR